MKIKIMMIMALVILLAGCSSPKGKACDKMLSNKLEYMKIKAATIGPAGLVLPKVPFIGKKLEKAKESAFSLTFNARGPLAKPKMHLSPMDKFKPKGKQ